MSAIEWLKENDIEPDSVSDTLIALLDACDDQKVANIMRTTLIALEIFDTN